MIESKLNVNLTFSGHALSLALSISQFTGMSLKQGKQIFQINVTQLKTPTGRRQTSWLFTKRDRGFELWTTEKQIPLVTGPPDYDTSALNHSGHAASLKNSNRGQQFPHVWVSQVQCNQPYFIVMFLYLTDQIFCRSYVQRQHSLASLNIIMPPPLPLIITPIKT